MSLDQDLWCKKIIFIFISFCLLNKIYFERASSFKYVSVHVSYFPILRYSTSSLIIFSFLFLYIYISIFFPSSVYSGRVSDSWTAGSKGDAHSPVFPRRRDAEQKLLWAGLGIVQSEVCSCHEMPGLCPLLRGEGELKWDFCGLLLLKKLRSRESASAW